MIIHVNNVAFVGTNIVKGLNKEKLEAKLVGDNSRRIDSIFGKDIPYNTPNIIHHHYLWSWNMPSSILRAKNLIVHAHGSDTIISKRKYILIKILLNIRKPLLLYSTPNLIDRLSWYEGEKLFFPNPIDTDLFRPIECQKFENRVLCWTQLSKVKGIDKIFSIAKLKPDIFFDIPDFGWDKNYYHSIAPKNINFISKVSHDKAPNLINKYNIVLGQFHDEEIFGQSELEVMSCNVPLIFSYNRQYDKFYNSQMPCISLKDSIEISKTIDKNVKCQTRKWVIRNHSIKKTTRDLIFIYKKEFPDII